MQGHAGKIIAIEGDTATVAFTRSSMCEKCGACKLSGDGRMEIQVQNTLKAKMGDTVELSVPPSSMLLAGLLVYILPLIALIAGVWLGSRWGDGVALGCGLGAALLVFLPVWLGKKKFEDKLSALIEKPVGHPTLVPINDKRPQITITSAADDFADHHENL